MKYKAALSYVFYALVGAFFVHLFLRNAPLTSIQSEIKKANLLWYVLVVVVSVAVYAVRTLRWQMMLRSVDCHAGFFETLSCISTGYFVSIGVPRLGEITRCLALSRRRHAPFAALLGTVITERIVDILALIAVLVFTYVVQNHAMRVFYFDNIINPLRHSITSHYLSGGAGVWLGMIAVCGAGVLLFYLARFLFTRLPQSAQSILQQARLGLQSIMRLRHAWLFFVYTLLIWVGYFFMTWFWFFAFEESSHLGWGVCLSIISIGTIGRSVPIQGGGTGAYHYLVEKVTAVYNISATMGKTLAIVIHGGQLIFTLLMGVLGWVYLSVVHPAKSE